MPKGKFQAFTQAFHQVGVWCLSKLARDAATSCPLPPWMLALLGMACPQGVWLYLTLFLVHSFHRFPGRGGWWGSKIKILL